MSVALIDSRRLTGANLFGDWPGAVIDVQLDAGAPDLVAHWERAVQDLLAECGQAGAETNCRRFKGGASLVIRSAIDALFAMCELNEVAWKQAVYACGEGPAPDLRAETLRLRDLFETERNPRLLQLQQAARDHHAPFLWDTEEVSVGHDGSCRVWPAREIPDPASLDWSQLRPVPLALVTGTNGKSTSVRMVAAIIQAAGLRSGLTSTDFIRVDGELVEAGDYSGPGGARTLLRHPRVEAAVLEVARGGLLRRGLGVERANAALITNVASDHLGEYGIHTVPELVEAKFIVRRALRPGDPLVLNADDEGITAYARALQDREPRTLWWFSEDAGHPLVREAIDRGNGACWWYDGALFTNAVSTAAGNGQPGSIRRIASGSEIPASHGGLLRHNIRNAMGAVLLGLALGLPDQAIRDGLANFRGDETDNPGRGNWFEHRGIRILVDFAHNEHGLQALAEAVSAMKPGRVTLLMGQAGDRTDEAIRAQARVACSLQPDRLLLCELPGHERGRTIEAVPALMRDEALACGLRDAQIEMFKAPLEAARAALAQARGGDVLVLLALIQREEILQLVHEFIDG